MARLSGIEHEVTDLDWACGGTQGLQDAIGLSVVHPTWKQTRPGKDEHWGWAFASPDDEPYPNPNGHGSFAPTDVIPDTVNGAKFVRDLYELTGNDPGTPCPCA